MTKEPTQGYVYILTNPSFKEDWVKIGKSTRPVYMNMEEKHPKIARGRYTDYEGGI